ncbi:MAG: hypothetical protein ACYDGO_12805 [Smithellaceae bacterium]
MKKYNGVSILCAVLLFSTILISPAFAVMDDKELQETNASVTGSPVKDPTTDSAKEAINIEREVARDQIAPPPTISNVEVREDSIDVRTRPWLQRVSDDAARGAWTLPR